eukprot:2222696-Pleurochrysis_carterae.AAC.1
MSEQKESNHAVPDNEHDVSLEYIGVVYAYKDGGYLSFCNVLALGSCLRIGALANLVKPGLKQSTLIAFWV